MNSPTDKPQKSKPAATETFSPEILVLVKQKLQLAKTVWWLLRNHNAISSPTALIDDESIPDLWNLTTRDVDGKLQITADLIPDLTDNQISNIVEMLLGSTKTIPDAIEQLKLPQPPQYIEAVIRPFIVLVKGTWVNTDLATAQVHPPGQ